MIHELERANYERVRPLFEPLRYHLASAAVLDGKNPGRVLVDDPGRPRTAFMLSPEGSYLAGDPDNDAFNGALHEAIFSRQIIRESLRYIGLVVHPERWRGRLPTVFEPLIPVEEPRRHYVCRALGYDWRAHVPEGYALRPIDRELLEDPRVIIPDHVTGWMAHNWGSIDRFLEDGLGCVSLAGDEVVSWSLADCVSGDECEIGIRTAPAHRRRGLASVTAAAAVEQALAGGFSMVGWHCPEDNMGSIQTAERVGFERERDYTGYYVFLEGEA